MLVECRHCGVSNQAQPVAGGAVTVVCDGCGRPFTVEHHEDEPLARVAPRRARARASGLLLPPDGGLLGPPAKDPEPTSPDFGSLLASPAQLGTMPTGEEGFDLSSILDPVPGGAGGTAPDLAASFTFGETVGEDSATRLELPPDELLDDSEATRVVDLGAVAQATASPSGWRVRSERGLIYELMTVDAVVAWLEGKSDIAGVRLARGEGDFDEVAAFPEIARRVGIRSQAPSEVPPAGGGLRLADRAPTKRTESAPAPHPRRERAPTEARQPEAPPMGMGFVLAALVVGTGLAGAAVAAGLATGVMSAPPVVAVVEAQSTEPSPALSRAIELFEAEKYTAAAAALGRVTAREEDPRALRYLAMALHKSNRESEARRALSRYRRKMLRASGDDGRQVREVRH